jgi:hypothetical protein
MVQKQDENANPDVPRLHGRNGYTPLAVVPAVLNGDYPPGEEPELCAICEQEITAGEHFVEHHSRPGYAHRHSDCGLPRQ